MFVVLEVFGTFAVTVDGFGAVIAKFTTCKMALVSWTCGTESVPAAWIVKLKSPVEPLAALITNAAPGEATGMMGVVAAEQTKGLVPVQVKLTGFAYALIAASVPSYCTV